MFFKVFQNINNNTQIRFILPYFIQFFSECLCLINIKQKEKRLMRKVPLELQQKQGPQDEF